MAYKGWTADDVKVIKSGKHTYEELSQTLGRSECSVRAFCNLNNLTHNVAGSPRRYWTEYEKALLMSGQYSCTDLSRLIHRSFASVVQYARRLGVLDKLKKKRVSWSSSDIALFECGEYTYEQIAEKTGHTVSATKTRAKLLRKSGVCTHIEPKNVLRYGAWTAAENMLIIDGKMTCEAIAKATGRSLTAVQEHIGILRKQGCHVSVVYRRVKWVDWEDEICKDTTLSNLEAADRLNRSSSAVFAHRYLLHANSRASVDETSKSCVTESADK